MKDLIEVNVHIGEVKLAKPTERLQALLGSCVGIALIHKPQRRVTLCHCLLPQRPTQQDSNQDVPPSGRWVDWAIESSLQLLSVLPSQYHHIDAVLAGGSNMVDQTINAKPNVGQSNVDMAHKKLNALGIPIVAEDIGGEHGRRINVSGATLDHSIEIIPKLKPSTH